MIVNALAWTCAALAAGGLLVECANLGDFARLRPNRTTRAGVDVYVAMRDEASNVPLFLEAILRDHNVATVTVADDESSDGTADAVRAVAAREPRVRLTSVPRGELGLSGKTSALASAYRAHPASAPYVLFTDADVRVGEGCVGSLIARARRCNAAAISAWPRVECPTLWSVLAAPGVTLLLLQVLPMWAARGSDPRFSAGNGQCFLVERDAYERAGGHTALHGVVEDVALAAAIKRTGERVVLASAARIATARGYGTARENARGYGRSLYFSAGAAGCSAVAVWQLAAYVAPFLLLAWAPVASCIAIACALFARVLAAIVMRERAIGVVLFPISGAVIAAIAAYAAFAGERARLSWRSRPLGKRSGPSAANERRR